MPRRDSPGVSTNDHASEAERDDGTEERESTDESIDVDRSGAAGSPAIEADPAEDRQAYLVEVAKASVSDPSAAGDEVGTLLGLLREYDGEVAEDVDVILDQLGESRPREFEVWSRDLAELADEPDPDAAFVGVRSLAQLAPVHPSAAAEGIDPALAAANSDHVERRRAGLAVVAEVGADDPEAVRGADPAVSDALRAETTAARVTGAVAAGKLLAADPTAFPRTANALPERLDDDAERVVQYTLVALANVAHERPAHLPARDRVLPALARTSDRELGLREGATGDAVAAVLEYETGE